MVAMLQLWSELLLSTSEFIFHLLVMSTPHYRNLPSSVHIVSFQYSSSSSMNSDVNSYYCYGPCWLTSALCNSEGLLKKMWEPALLFIYITTRFVSCCGRRMRRRSSGISEALPCLHLLNPFTSALHTYTCDFLSICRNESSDFNSSL